MDMEEMQNRPYAEWLEDGVANIFQKDPKAICLMAILPDGQVLSGYYNSDIWDKAMFKECVNQDITLDVINSNSDRIKEILDGGVNG